MAFRAEREHVQKETLDESGRAVPIGKASGSPASLRVSPDDGFSGCRGGSATRWVAPGAAAFDERRQAVGRVKVNVAPRPGLLRTPRPPSCASMTRLQMLKPSP
jgi:hypothetical protein